MKELIRLLVTSDAFKRSSEPSIDGMEKDASSALLWRFPPRRVEAENDPRWNSARLGKLNPALSGRAIVSIM